MLTKGQVDHHSLILAASGSDMRRKMAASSDEPVSSLSREVWSVLAYISENGSNHLEG